MKRHVGLVEVGPHPLGRLDQDVLDDVAGVDPSLDLAVEAHLDHSPERGPVPVHEVVEPRRVRRRRFSAAGNRSGVLRATRCHLGMRDAWC